MTSIKNKMTLSEYFQIVQLKIKNEDFYILEINKKPYDKLFVYIESINHMIYKWCNEHNDLRTQFDYILIPDDIDFDFSTIPFKDFIIFLSKEKSKSIEYIIL